MHNMITHLKLCAPLQVLPRIFLSLCCSTVYHCNGAQWYEQFLQVGRLDWALILLSASLYFSKRGAY